MLYEKQVRNLTELLSGDQNLVLQMIMGSGKSKILLPMLALRCADGDRLPVIIAPEPLLESLASDMQVQVGQTFHTKVHRITLTRRSDYSAPRMKALYEQLESIRTKKECLLMSSKSAGCLLASFQEAMTEYQSGEEVPENIQWKRFR